MWKKKKIKKDEPLVYPYYCPKCSWILMIEVIIDKKGKFEGLNLEWEIPKEEEK